MAHGRNLCYKVCVYEGATGRTSQTLKTFGSRQKAEDYLSEYLRNHDEVTRAYIETVYHYKNDKRKQW